MGNLRDIIESNEQEDNDEETENRNEYERGVRNAAITAGLVGVAHGGHSMFNSNKDIADKLNIRSDNIKKMKELKLKSDKIKKYSNTTSDFINRLKRKNIKSAVTQGALVTGGTGIAASLYLANKYKNKKRKEKETE